MARGSLSKCAVRFREFIETVWTCARVSRELASVSSSSGDDEKRRLLSERAEKLKTSAEAMGDALSREVKLHDVEVRKLVSSSRASDANARRCDGELTRMEHRIEAARGDIETLTGRYANERLVRRHREEYEALAEMANARHPPVRVTAEELKKAREEIKLVREEERRARKELAVREKQFRVLMQSIQDLKATFQVEDLKRRDISAVLPGGKRRRVEQTNFDDNDVTGAL